jgi:hypothetical protein
MASLSIAEEGGVQALTLFYLVLNPPALARLKVTVSYLEVSLKQGTLLI